MQSRRDTRVGKNGSCEVKRIERLVHIVVSGDDIITDLFPCRTCTGDVDKAASCKPEFVIVRVYS
jgi:hypothetical protein